jgi:hypothetical protein
MNWVESACPYWQNIIINQTFTSFKSSSLPLPKRLESMTLNANLQHPLRYRRWRRVEVSWTLNSTSQTLYIFGAGSSSYISWFCGVVGYHFCLTHRRSPVRARAESSFCSSFVYLLMGGCWGFRCWRIVLRVCGGADGCERALACTTRLLRRGVLGGG